MTPELLTIEDVAARLRVGASTVQRLIATNQIVSIKLGGRRRIHVASVDDFLSRSMARQGDPS